MKARDYAFAQEPLGESVESAIARAAAFVYRSTGHEPIVMSRSTYDLGVSLGVIVPTPQAEGAGTVTLTSKHETL